MFADYSMVLLLLSLFLDSLKSNKKIEAFFILLKKVIFFFKICKETEGFRVGFKLY